MQREVPIFLVLVLFLLVLRPMGSILASVISAPAGGFPASLTGILVGSSPANVTGTPASGFLLSSPSVAPP